MDRRIGDDNRGWWVAMTGLRNWRPRQKCRKRKIRPGYWGQEQRRKFRKQMIQCIWVNVSDGRGASVFTGSGYWRRQWRRWQIKTGPQTQQQQQRRWQRRNKSKVLDTTTDAVGARRRARGIYDNNRGVGGGKWAQRLKQQQQRRRRRIDDASKGSETTMEAAADWRHAQWIGKSNEVLIFLAIGVLTVTLYHIYLVAVSFWYCFHQIPFCHCLLHKILSVLQSCKN